MLVLETKLAKIVFFRTEFPDAAMCAWLLARLRPPAESCNKIPETCSEIPETCHKIPEIWVRATRPAPPEVLSVQPDPNADPDNWVPGKSAFAVLWKALGVVRECPDMLLDLARGDPRMVRRFGRVPRKRHLDTCLREGRHPPYNSGKVNLRVSTLKAAMLSAHMSCSRGPVMDGVYCAPVPVHNACFFSTAKTMHVPWTRWVLLLSKYVDASSISRVAAPISSRKNCHVSLCRPTRTEADALYPAPSVAVFSQREMLRVLRFDARNLDSWLQAWRLCTTRTLVPRELNNFSLGTVDGNGISAEHFLEDLDYPLALREMRRAWFGYGSLDTKRFCCTWLQEFSHLPRVRGINDLDFLACMSAKEFRSHCEKKTSTFQVPEFLVAHNIVDMVPGTPCFFRLSPTQFLFLGPDTDVPALVPADNVFLKKIA